MIRITGGKFRSRKLVTPETSLTKPTMDKVRLGVFNALGNDLSGLKVLDLFSGSGSYGFEAISRGAISVDFVDQTKFSKEAIRQNALTLGISSYEFYFNDVLSFLNEIDMKYDLIFMDPPYKLDIIKETLKLIDERKLLNQNGAIIVESEQEITFNEKYKDQRHYRYGLAHVYLLRK